MIGFQSTAIWLSATSYGVVVSSVYTMERLPSETTDMIIDVVGILQEPTVPILINRCAPSAALSMQSGLILSLLEIWELAPLYAGSGLHAVDAYSSKC